MIKFLAVLIVSFGLSFNALANMDLTWDASGELISILVEGDFPDSVLEDSRNLEEVDFERSSCQAEVYRPHRDDGAVTDGDNALTCKVVYTDNSSSEFVVNLADVPIEAWGTSFDREPFQVVDHQFATDLYAAIKKAHERSPRIANTSEMNMVSPCGNYATQVYFLNNPDAPDGTAHIACDKQYELTNGSFVEYQTRCVFLFP